MSSTIAVAAGGALTTQVWELDQLIRRQPIGPI